MGALLGRKKNKLVEIGTRENSARQVCQYSKGGGYRIPLCFRKCISELFFKFYTTILSDVL
jgi:hypothetical protein